MTTTPRAGFRQKFIGDKAFYKTVAAIALPIMIQSGISQFVSMLDNIMVGRVGTEEMSAVAIINQLNFVYMLCIFGGVGGIGIFTAQYFGAGDEEGVRRTFRVKIWVAFTLSLIATLIFLFFGSALIGFYLHDDALGTGNVELTLRLAEDYLHILLISFPAFFMLQVYMSTLRECGETLLPMKAGIVAVAVNLVGNFLLIYGKFGLPNLGVQGAAIATVVARYVEALIVILWTHTHKKKCPWIVHAYRTLWVPFHEAKRYLIRGLPLLMNETLWSTGQAVLTQCFATRGLTVVAGLNIASTLNNFVEMLFLTLASTVGIMIGQLLGAGKLEEAKDKDNKLLFLSVAVSLISAALLVVGSFFFPNFYNTTPEVKAVAVSFMIAYACVCPKNSFLNSAYFTLRAGGKTIRTFIFDSGCVWLISIPIAFVLSRFTNLSALMIFIIAAIADLSKVALGIVWVKSNIWLNDLVKNRPAESGTDQAANA